MKLKLLILNVKSFDSGISLHVYPTPFCICFIQGTIKAFQGTVKDIMDKARVVNK